MLTDWYCNNLHGDSILNELKKDSNPSCVYWIDKNIVYYNKSCMKVDDEVDQQDLDISFNPFFCIYIRDTYLKAYDYSKNNIIPFIQPGVCLIE